MGYNNNSDLIYSTLVNQFNLKFKKQYSNSTIIFEKYIEVKDILANEIHYVLVFDSKKIIKFTDKRDFVENFIVYLRSELEALDNKFEELQRIACEERLTDENALFLEHEEIGSSGQGILNLIKKMESFRE